jgi:hypothetical protein
MRHYVTYLSDKGPLNKETQKIRILKVEVLVFTINNEFRKVYKVHPFNVFRKSEAFACTFRTVYVNIQYIQLN